MEQAFLSAWGRQESLPHMELFGGDVQEVLDDGRELDDDRREDDADHGHQFGEDAEVSLHGIWTVTVG